MSGESELDKVAEARRRIADHAGFPRSYWVTYGMVLVLFAGVPIWRSYLPEGAGAPLSWGIAAVGLASAAYTVVRRRRSGVYLPRRISSYPTARPLWIAGLVAAAGGFLGVHLLVEHDRRGLAIALVVVVAAVVFALEVATRSAMRADIEAGRVRP